MFITGMGTTISTFFQTTTMIISIPSVIILTCLFISLWGGSIRFNTPMLFALAFLPMFGIGGLTGLPLGFNFSDLHLHDTYYVIAHFHYVVAPGTIFALMAGVYHWYPKVHRDADESDVGQDSFLGLVRFHELHLHANALHGHVGRIAPPVRSHGCSIHEFATQPINELMSFAAWAVAAFADSVRHQHGDQRKGGKKVSSDNPWDSTTLEWTSSSPPAHGNFPTPVEVFRDPYEYDRNRALPQFKS